MAQNRDLLTVCDSIQKMRKLLTRFPNIHRLHWGTLGSIGMYTLSVHASNHACNPLTSLLSFEQIDRVVALAPPVAHRGGLGTLTTDVIEQFGHEPGATSTTR